jgi:hypothetical protein
MFWLLLNNTPAMLVKAELFVLTVIPVRLAQPPNTFTPMFVTLFGIVTLFRLMQLKNAPFPMLVTGRPLIEPGMVTSPPGPVYPVILIVPLLVVQVYGTHIAVGRPPNVDPHPVVSGK